MGGYLAIVFIPQTNTKSMREKKQKCLKQVRRLSLISPKKYIMPDSIFEQPFVYCGVCHRRTSHGDPLRLTSCAHILCSQHSPLTSKVCPICRSSDISIINLVDSKQLPTDIRIFFEPLPPLLESLYNVSQFQLNGLSKQCQYYQNHCLKLREKCARQQQLLYQAKIELDSMAILKKRIQELESVLNHNNVSSMSVGVLPTRNSHQNHYQPPPTVDLTVDDNSLEEFEAKSFIKKLKKNSSLRNSSKNNNGTVTPSTSGRVNKNQPLFMETLNNPNRDRIPPPGMNPNANSNLPNISTIAESTNLNRFSFSPVRVAKGFDGKLPNLDILTNNGSVSSKNISRLSSASLQPSSPLSSSSNRLILPNSNLKELHHSNTPLTSTSTQFPSALEKLKITRKRNNTISGSNRITHNLSSHVRSSGLAFSSSSNALQQSKLPKSNILKRSNSTQQLTNTHLKSDNHQPPRSSNTVLGSSKKNNKFRRIR
ncbi:ANL_collapsed_G0039050.mRNA.1.CDS.1 [Saccharomyces cerevisiae]|nr:ANL_HP_G0063560.mRNA.1.CDS.1 [Saccharomyces cerevisiae]CAI5125249.1 ANL_HP_G0113650.mRNA.1.CDS.1 [Saccharomyces cerevisiae]CAI6823315.1 ANL_collapsed_G0039050.mRNA.1.CDS.1 [Saccharomyces cerevisiae]CAI6927721.1 ANL_HP_G0063560.mRNA.1.CDS.1 [Saccharomyces cerevisiae]CAI6982883.1 ANL_HP_G0113650.mRNA.1.CDS.1 [Saccharomyces cerevisiae]